MTRALLQQALDALEASFDILDPNLYPKAENMVAYSITAIRKELETIPHDTTELDRSNKLYAAEQLDLIARMLDGVAGCSYAGQAPTFGMMAKNVTAKAEQLRKEAGE